MPRTRLDEKIRARRRNRTQIKTLSAAMEKTHHFVLGWKAHLEARLLARHYAALYDQHRPKDAPTSDEQQRMRRQT